MLNQQLDRNSIWQFDDLEHGPLHFESKPFVKADCPRILRCDFECNKVDPRQLKTFQAVLDNQGSDASAAVFLDDPDVLDRPDIKLISNPLHRRAVFPFGRVWIGKGGQPGCLRNKALSVADFCHQSRTPLRIRQTGEHVCIQFIAKASVLGFSMGVKKSRLPRMQTVVRRHRRID